MVDKTDIFDGAETVLKQGITLIEASAGTGKTFAISMLVLRAVVELGIDLKEILVVTYTVAATEELRGRIRSRLVQARNMLRGTQSQADPVLKRWLALIEDKGQAERRLDLALLDIDSMGIHTIHGFCQRILAEQVLESGHFFDTELISDTSSVRNDLIRDFWRRRLYSADKRYGSLIVGCYPTPLALHQSIRGAENPLSKILPAELTFKDACRKLDGGWERLKTWWVKNGQRLGDELYNADQQGLLKNEPSRQYQGWLDLIESSFNQGSSPDPVVVAKLLEDNLVGTINGRKIRGEDKKRALVASWTLPGEAAESYLEGSDQLLLAVRLELAEELRRELTKRLHEQGLVSFDELIIDLAQAISSVTGESLVRQVGGRYRVALIDEFQDTDSAQYEIFSRLFGQGAHHLYLIGDPKQAIYRFRGADIDSYLQARELVDRRLTLDCNFRSNPGLVGALNHLLTGNEIGGTLYQPVRSPENIDYHRLVEADSEQPGLIYCQLDGNSEKIGWSAGTAEEQIRLWVVNEVVRLIDSGTPPAILSPNEGNRDFQRAIKPCDIGILVRTNRQAEDFFSEFSRRGIPAVLSSSKDVFQTRESSDLLLVLQAVASPSNTGLQRTVLGLDWFGLSGDSYFQVCSDEERFNLYRERFYEYHRQWNESGLLLMMNSLLEDEEVFLHLSRKPQAERRITNIHHLVELIHQQQNQRRLSISRTLIWCQEKQKDPADLQEAELRLESDSDAVNVITMHSAKGLEYEIVFCPFLFRSTVSAKTKGAVNCIDPEQGRISDLGSERFALHAQLSLQEEVEEEMRLAYVALTRARLRSYLIWAELKTGSSFDSPVGRMLFPWGSCSFELQQERLQELGSAAHCQYRLIEADQAPLHYLPPASRTGALKARESSGRRLQTNRIRTSFSGLTMLSMAHGDEHHKAGDESSAEVQPYDTALPGGVRFGNLIHDALEMFDFTDLGDGAVSSEQLDKLMRKYRYDIDPEPVRNLLRNAVCTPLMLTRVAEQGFSLAQITDEYAVKEMEFTLHLDPISTTELNRILGREPTVSVLNRRDLEGYLSGFIDLVFKHRGRYYVVDYKTNNLGPESAYRNEGLVEAMQVHNYGLQYWLYTLVVHRFLHNWLEGYRYEVHFGGVMYLFVRGMQPDRPGSGVFFDRPEEATLMALDHYFGIGGGGGHD